MEMTSLSFLYLFLPVSLAVFYLCPKKGRPAVLLTVSVCFFLLRDPASLLLAWVSVTVDYLLGRLMERHDEKYAVRYAISAGMVIKNLALFLLVSIYCQMNGLTAPLGLAVWSLLGLSYGVDIYNGEALYEHDYLRFLLAHLLFCKLPAGPLPRYRWMHDELTVKPVDPVQVANGVCLFLQGIAKQVILGVPLQRLYRTIVGFYGPEHSVFSLWLMPLCAAMSLYFTLSGYCDMARGLGGMFGVRLPRNFYYPYQSRSVTDFVGRFNISVTDYLKTYIYHPLGEDSGGFLSASLNIGVVTLLWGLWFGFRINYLLWGAFFVLLILLERHLWGKFLMKIPVFFQRIYTFSMVLLSFVIFNGNSVGQSFFFFKGMLGMESLPFTTPPILYLASQYAPYLILSVIFSTSLPHSVKLAVKKRSDTLSALIAALVYGILLFICTGFILHP
ncbi:MAG: hypothetical protein IJE98_04335 [Oscillospiraceae bacterium]|nr:hypothetical protein [Oscillospiraceae bacterium]